MSNIDPGRRGNTKKRANCKIYNAKTIRNLPSKAEKFMAFALPGKKLTLPDVTGYYSSETGYIDTTTATRDDVMLVEFDTEANAKAATSTIGTGARTLISGDQVNYFIRHLEIN